MKTITRKYEVYTLEELDKKGWQKAYNDWLTLHDYPHNSDNSATMNAFCKLFRVNCYRWEYDAYTFSFTMSTEHDNSIEELSGQRLATYLTNNYWNAIFAPTTYWSKNYKKETQKPNFQKQFVCAHRVLH